jgi:hypothetical protein
LPIVRGVGEEAVTLVEKDVKVKKQMVVDLISRFLGYSPVRILRVYPLPPLLKIPAPA